LPIYSYGEIIKDARERQGVSQAALADGIIDAGQLSRIERGTAKPNKATLELIFERLGINHIFLAEYMLDVDDAEIEGIKSKIDAHLRQNEFADAKKLMTKLEKNKRFQDEQSAAYKPNMQYIMSCKARLAKEEGQHNEALAMYMEALYFLSPNFDLAKIDKKFLLSKLDIQIINSIAGIYHAQRDLDKAIDLMLMLKANYDRRFMGAVEKGTLYPMTIYNLTKYLGMAGRHKEAIEYCEVGEKICHELGDMRMLPWIVYNKTASQSELGIKGIDYETIFRELYYSFRLQKRYDEAIIVKGDARDYHGIDVHSAY